MNFNLLNQVLRSEIYLHWDGQLRVVHVILGFNPISTCFQVSKHVIKAKVSCLVLIDVAIKRFIGKPPPAKTQLVQLLDQPETQPLVMEITSSDNEAEDFEVFYHPDVTEDIASTL